MSNTAEVINFPIKTELTGGRMADLSNGYTKIANEIETQAAAADVRSRVAVS
jgi:hypothetical protein